MSINVYMYVQMYMYVYIVYTGNYALAIASASLPQRSRGNISVTALGSLASASKRSPACSFSAPTLMMGR